ncbi:MAG: sulfotransferase, partial [Actinobacteria bacterium]|nr:sulfotransferase [Actinomycetota bacterium]
QSWQHRLEPWEISLCEAVMGRRLRSLGYELSGAPRPSAAHLQRYARMAALRRAAAGKRTLTDRLERAREPGPVACQL